jgi:uncharacterized protein YdhG (YjbR/CyaY superfamily)
MKTKQKPPQNIDDYIAGFPKDVQKILEKIRATIRKAAPDAKEAMKYQIPTFTTRNGNLVHFAAFKNHIGFYPAPGGIDEFKKELAPYRTGKGTLQFLLDQPIPFSLITKVVKFRMKQTEQNKKEKNKR